MTRVGIAGVGSSRFGKFRETSLRTLVADATDAAMKQSGISADGLDAVFFGNAAAGLLVGQEMIRGQVQLQPTGIDGIPVVNVENACASASTALHLAWMSVVAGVYDVVLAVGGEKMSGADKQAVFQALSTALDVESEAAAREVMEARSPFMDVYADMTHAYMDRSGATREDFALIAKKNHHNGGLNPIAQYGGELTIEEILGAREIVSPLSLYMCSPIGDGAAAVVVGREEALRGLNIVPIWIEASILMSGKRGASGGGAAARAAQRAYEVSGLSPRDVDVVEVHDAVAPAEIMSYEDIGIAARGEGPRLVRSGETSIGGSMPVNPSGGLLARGHPIGATGLAQIVELVQQLRGEAGPRQVAGAEVALAQNGGGWLNGDVGAESIHILSTRSSRS